MNFLKCFPSVFVIENRYEIAITLKEKGLCYVKINERAYYEENSGVLSSEKNFIKISVPQQELNIAKKYEIIYRKTIDRKAYFSEFADEVTETFNFKPLEKTENIKIYHIADVHYAFEKAIAIAKFFDKTDLFILNGDIGEVETTENYFEVCDFCGKIAKGEIPIVFVRGNHDTRGKLAEDYTKYFPSINNKTYFTFEIGNIYGIVLDCGEDKLDDNIEYGGVNIFQEYRKNETRFLKELKCQNKDKIVLAICHICPVLSSLNKGDKFDIERDEYTKWNKELERLGVKLMLCGHYHKAFILKGNDDINIINHNYHVIIGSENDGKTLQGAGIILNKENALVMFTDEDCKESKKFELKL